jgi:hypothetical protein
MPIWMTPLPQTDRRFRFEPAGADDMGQCTCHPEKESHYQCMKHGVFLCDECLKCRDPHIYCKFRSSCPIWFMEKRQKGLERQPQADTVGHRCEVIAEPAQQTVDVALLAPR